MTVKEICEIAQVSGAAAALVEENSTPATYLEGLEKQELYQDAIKFLAQKLDVNAGIKWAVACMRELQSPERQQQKDEALDAADRWTKAPSEPARRAAKEAYDKSELPGPTKLVAMAVFFSGGSIASPAAPETPPPANAAQKLVAGSIQIAVVSYQAQKAKERYQRVLAIGKTFDQPGKGPL